MTVGDVPVCLTCGQYIYSVPHRCGERPGFVSNAMGCICPPGSERTCQGALCPRRSFSLPIT